MLRQDVNPAIRDGLQIIAAFRARGVHLSLRPDGTPVAGPRSRLEVGDLELLEEQRHLVIAALGWEAAGRGVGAEVEQ
jgi:hypothetical protein